MEMSKKIKMITIDKGVKMKDLAKDLGCTPEHLSVNLSRGIKTIDQASRILDALDCEIVVVDKKTKKVY